VLLASKIEDYVQEKALAEKKDHLLQLPLKDVKANSKAQGWLFKTGNKNKRDWKKRYCVLKDNYLFYYKTDNEKRENKGKWIRLIDAKLEVVGDRKKKTNVFVIHPKELAGDDKKKKGGEDFYELTGIDKEDSDKWIDQLKAHISSLSTVEIKEVVTRTRNLTLTKSMLKMEEGKGKEPQPVLKEIVEKLEEHEKSKDLEKSADKLVEKPVEVKVEKPVEAKVEIIIEAEDKHEKNKKDKDKKDKKEKPEKVDQHDKQEKEVAAEKPVEVIIEGKVEPTIEVAKVEARTEGAESPKLSAKEEKRLQREKEAAAKKAQKEQVKKEKDDKKAELKKKKDEEKKRKQEEKVLKAKQKQEEKAKAKAAKETEKPKEPEKSTEVATEKPKETAEAETGSKTAEKPKDKDDSDSSSSTTTSSSSSASTSSKSK